VRAEERPDAIREALRRCVEIRVGRLTRDVDRRERLEEGVALAEACAEHRHERRAGGLGEAERSFRHLGVLLEKTHSSRPHAGRGAIELPRDCAPALEVMEKRERRERIVTDVRHADACDLARVVLDLARAFVGLGSRA
jgi:hypothetical protein